MTIACRCQGLAAGWAGKRLLDGAELDIEFAELGHCLPIVGRTGLGKSTLLYAMSGMAQPMAGGITWHLPTSKRREPASWIDVSWSGESARSFRPAAKLRSLSFGFLLQDDPLIPCLTVQENLLHGMRLRGVGGSHRQKLARIREACAGMTILGENVDRLLDVYPRHLSGGQLQRMALAAATVHDPAVLFADEPTGSLDERTGLQVLRSVRKWLDAAERPGDRAFVFVTHSLRIIRQGVGTPRMLSLHKRDDRGRLELAWEEAPCP